VVGGPTEDRNMGNFLRSADLDENDNFDEDEFEIKFNKRKSNDPVEEARRNLNLRINEKIVKDENEQYLSGQETWAARVYSFDDESEGQFLKEKTGGKVGRYRYSRRLGGFFPDENATVEERSERYFERVRLDRRTAPDSYSAVERNWVTPVRHQRSCGSCVAFASVAVMEVLFKKLTGQDNDFSEQQLVDCAYWQFGAKGCGGASYDAYFKWMKKEKKQLTHESKYPYKARRGHCNERVSPHKRGAKITDEHYTWTNRDEKTLKKEVYLKGAVVGAVAVDRKFQNYDTGIFDGCWGAGTPNHAVAIVGYGTEGGVDYWLIKNSWGTTWGEEGYMKLKRGVNMCNVEKVIATIDVEKVDGPTDAPLTTTKPCRNIWNNCETNRSFYCNHSQHYKSCLKTCNRC